MVSGRTAGADGVVNVPGDKSTSTRALLLALLAEGPCTVRNVAPSRTTDHVVGVLRALGASVDVVGSTVRVSPPASLADDAVLDCGGSATLARIVLGLLAGAGKNAVVDGSAMLRRRPMERVREPLARYFGRDVVTLDDGHLPARVHKGPPPPTSTEPVTCLDSAQVRSALCFAAFAARLPFPVTYDHSETRRSLEHLCAEIEIDLADPRVPAFTVTTPGDPSAEAFPLALALALGRSLAITSPAYPGWDRIGFQLAITKMGARFPLGLLKQERELLARVAPLTGIVVAADPVPRPSLTAGPHVYAQGLWLLIDEIPILAALCALATTPSRLCGLAELRLKESDRVSRTAEMLQAFGAAVVEEGDDLVIEPATLRQPTTAIRTDHDHRIAMTALTLGHILDVDVELDDEACVDESWRGFGAFIGDAARQLRAQHSGG